MGTQHVHTCELKDLLTLIQDNIIFLMLISVERAASWHLDSELSLERVTVAEVGFFKARRHRESLFLLESDRLITLAAAPTSSTRTKSYHHLTSSFVAG